VKWVTLPLEIVTSSPTLSLKRKLGFRHVKVYCNSDNALAGLIREIRNDFLYVPGFELSELEEFVYVASTF